MIFRGMAAVSPAIIKCYTESRRWVLRPMRVLFEAFIIFRPTSRTQKTYLRRDHPRCLNDVIHVIN